MHQYIWHCIESVFQSDMIRMPALWTSRDWHKGVDGKENSDCYFGNPVAALLHETAGFCCAPTLPVHSERLSCAQLENPLGLRLT
mmetsp:Transcript_63258/g.105338  ORF Transcript_63258/g.105338 Transcript_63258/m.105338 type:complete len:85 (-) Transcript_63258:59-313(-)